MVHFDILLGSPLFCFFLTVRGFAVDEFDCCLLAVFYAYVYSATDAIYFDQLTACVCNLVLFGPFIFLHGTALA